RAPAILLILRCRQEAHVVGVDALSDVAKVVDHQPVWDWPVDAFPCVAMGADHSGDVVEMPVTVVSCRAGPLPAARLRDLVCSVEPIDPDVSLRLVRA